jgi:hypothetical protein
VVNPQNAAFFTANIREPSTSKAKGANIMHNIIFIRRRLGEKTAKRVILILAIAFLVLLALGIGLLVAL